MLQTGVMSHCRYCYHDDSVKCEMRSMCLPDDPAYGGLECGCDCHDQIIKKISQLNSPDDSDTLDESRTSEAEDLD